MKYKVFCHSFLLFFCLLNGAYAAPKIQNEYNKFTEISTCQMQNIDIKTKEGI
jgi:hypothetical protein